MFRHIQSSVVWCLVFVLLVSALGCKSKSRPAASASTETLSPLSVKSHFTGSPYHGVSLSTRPIPTPRAKMRDRERLYGLRARLLHRAAQRRWDPGSHALGHSAGKARAFQELDFRNQIVRHTPHGGSRRPRLRPECAFDGSMPRRQGGPAYPRGVYECTGVNRAPPPRARHSVGHWIKTNASHRSDDHRDQAAFGCTADEAAGRSDLAPPRLRAEWKAAFCEATLQIRAAPGHEGKHHRGRTRIRGWPRVGYR